MSVRVQLPPGCSGITCQDGTRYSGRKGGSVVVEDRHAAAIPHSKLGTMLSAKFAVAAGTSKARVCPMCHDNRRWNSWNKTCPKCGATTILESVTER